ncbi:MAG: hypothetical protein SGJ21_01635 [Alphaproteobacteria bacterium]|nr:hypothetical protein [Alphaproteobacteria bacterium]
MPDMTPAPGAGLTAGKSDYDALKNDIKALRADLSALVQDTGKVAGEEAKRQAEKARMLADSAGKQMTEYRDVVEDKVRDHPFAAIGIALAAGFIVASLGRRS